MQEIIFIDSGGLRYSIIGIEVGGFRIIPVIT